jgi:hypothetical protein
MTFKLKSPIYNAKKIFLKSFETPLLFPNVRSTSNLNFIILNCNGTNKTITIPDNTYNSITNLCNDLTTYANLQYPSDGITFAVSTTTNLGNIQITSTTNSTISVNYSNLGYVLGFRVGIDTTASNNVYASYKYNLAFDTLLHLYLPNLGHANSSTNSGVLSSFKVLLTQTSGVVNFNAEGVGFQQHITVSNPTTPITEISICVFDRLGFSIPSYGADVSITLGVETAY